MNTFHFAESKKKKFFSKTVLIIFLQILFVFNVNAQFSTTKKGIIVKINDKLVELAVAKTMAFRISVATSENSNNASSIFLDDSENTQAKFTTISQSPIVGIKTAFGELYMNTDLKTWSVRDASGKLLVFNGSINFSDTLQMISYEGGKEKSLTYGSGNYSTKNLTKSNSVALQGNGTVDSPYLWNNEGYCVMGITADDNKPATWSSKGSHFNWSFKGKSADLYIWPAPTVYDANAGLVKLTGKPKLPPKWAFGYLQSQWGWQDRAYIEDALMKFRTHKLPVDAFIYDFEWYTTTPDYFVKEFGKSGFSDFSFNPKLFPEPSAQIADYKKQGVKFIGIRKPRLGDSLTLILARKNGWLKKSDYNNRDIDFSNADLRKWYADKNKPLLEAGVDAWWNDEGESYYSCYYWWNKTQVDLRATVLPNNRHFSINRSFSLGNQRLGYCTWNGDIQSTWNALKDTPADLLNWSLSGMYYTSCDIGGFGSVNPSKELLVRWFQTGVFLPMMRAHSNIFMTPHFPWLWEADGEAAIRKALNLRYQLLPYIYSLGHEAFNTGAPIMRPLVMEFPNDTMVVNLTDEWLLGKGLLAAPLINEGGKRDVYLPKGLWYDFETGKPIFGPTKISITKKLDEIPVYVRAGTILPLGPVIQYSNQDTIAPLEIRIYPGCDGKFTLTEDDGISYNYLKGDVRSTIYTWSEISKSLSWKVEGSYSDKKVFKTIRVICGKSVKTAVIGNNGSVEFK